MASSTSDYFSQQTRPAIRPRQTSNLAVGTPGSPRTPLLGRSISGQFGSPGTPFRSEQEDHVVYELGARHLSAGFAGESRPRCILAFGPEESRRVGDFRAYSASYQRPRKKLRREVDWGKDHELYRADIRSLDPGLVEDKLERAVLKAHADFLQLTNKPLKAVLVIPSLLPTPLLEIVLKVLFNHCAQPPSIMLLSTPILACVGAGLRNALVVDVGWEETVVTAVGEYKEVYQRRSVRAGKMLTTEMANMVEGEVKSQRDTQNASDGSEVEVSFDYAEELTRRMAWCRPRPSQPTVASYGPEAKLVTLPYPCIGHNSTKTINVFITRLAEPAERTLINLSTPDSSQKADDHESPIPDLMYTALLALPLEIRALCVSRIVFTGGISALPGLRHRFLQELSHLLEIRGWDFVCNYGNADKLHSRILTERSANISAYQAQESNRQSTATLKQTEREALPAHQRPHDDEGDTLTERIERRAKLGEKDVVKGVVRGVTTVGPWAGASLVASLRVKGACEVEREEFLKHGIKDTQVL